MTFPMEIKEQKKLIMKWKGDEKGKKVEKEKKMEENWLL